jgi:hypothetical protein
MVDGVKLSAADALTSGDGSVEIAVAEARSTLTMVVALHDGCAARTRAATPATRGAEALVPMAWT